MAKAKCPVCAQDLATPFFLNVDAWRWLVCPHCAARLERKKPRYVVTFLPFFIVLTAIGRGTRFAVFAEVLMVAIVVVIFVEFFYPQLQVRKPPKPEITLNTGGPSN